MEYADYLVDIYVSENATCRLEYECHGYCICIEGIPTFRLVKDTLRASRNN